jgi:hypothetical protein
VWMATDLGPTPGEAGTSAPFELKGVLSQNAASGRATAFASTNAFALARSG